MQHHFIIKIAQANCNIISIRKGLEKGNFYDICYNGGGRLANHYVFFKYCFKHIKYKYKYAKKLREKCHNRGEGRGSDELCQMS